jgi:signal peptidase I
VRHGELYINDQLVPRKEDPNCIDKEAGPFIVQLGYRESLPRASGGGAVQHCIIKEFGFGGREDGPLDNTPVYDVPADHYFAMGDNRDNSQDSRVLSAVGYIPNENLVGQAQFIFFSTDGSAHWWEVWKWPFAIRYSRLFRGVS